MLSQMQFNIQYEDALDLPSGELVNVFEKLSFIRIIEVVEQSPIMLFSATLMKNKSIDDVNAIPAMELTEVLSLDGKDVLFSTRMSGPIARLIVSQTDAWPIAPILIESKQLVLSMPVSYTHLRAHET